MSDLSDCTASELLDLYRDGDASPVEAVTACLDRIDAVDDDVNAILLRLAEQAMAQAADSTQRWQRGEARPLEVRAHLRRLSGARGARERQRRRRALGEALCRGSRGGAALGADIRRTPSPPAQSQESVDRTRLVAGEIAWCKVGGAIAPAESA